MDDLRTEKAMGKLAETRPRLRPAQSVETLRGGGRGVLHRADTVGAGGVGREGDPRARGQVGGVLRKVL